MPKKVFIQTYGCQMNFRDSEIMASQLKKEGYELTPEKEEADLILFNTCCVRENADQRLYNSVLHLRGLKKKKPDLIIGVGGCLVEKDKDELTRQLPHVDVAFGTHALYELPEMIQSVHSGRKTPRSKGEKPLQVVQVGGSRPIVSQAEFGVRGEGHRAWITVSEGCHHRCAFCIVPHVRGHERSKPVAMVMEEVHSAVAEGYPEICLLGQNINSYGRDLDDRPSLVDLFRKCNEVEDLKRIRFATSNPMDMRDEILEAMAEAQKVCDFLHLPLQSGSDRILYEMRRGYKTARYREIIDRARSLMPDLCLSTDIIVGFPGETDDDYEKTIEAVKEMRFDNAYIFKYSQRPGTRAADLPGQVSQGTIEERHALLLGLQKTISKEINGRMLNRNVELMIEGRGKEPGYLMGRTRNYKVTLFKPPAGALEHKPGRFNVGRLLRARVVGMKNFTLIAEPILEESNEKVLVA